MAISASKTKRNGKATAALAMGAAVVALSLFLILPREHSILRCVKSGQCEGVVMRATNITVTGTQLTKLLEDPVLSGVRRSIGQSSIMRTPDGRENLVLVASIQNADEAFYVPVIQEGDEQVILLGNLLSRMMEIKEREAHPESKTFGPIYRGIAEDVRTLVPSLQQAGISNIEFFGAKAVSVNVAADQFMAVAQLNENKPLMTFRP